MRPKGEPMQVISFRVPPPLAEKLRLLAEQTERTPSDLMRLLLKQAQLTGQPDVVLKG